MLFEHATFIGINPTGSRAPYTYTALDENLKLLALGEGESEEVLAFVGGQETAVVSVCAPRRANQGLMNQEDVRQKLTPQPRPGRWTDYRLAEYELRQHGIGVIPTPADEHACPPWKQRGFNLFRYLDKFGYQPYPTPDAALQSIEVDPHAVWCALCGYLPLPKDSLEGRLQRQVILDDLGLGIPDPMMFFEEVTRHWLRQGVLPLKNIYAAAELDALAAAYTAWQAGLHPDQICHLGDPREGEIILPVPSIKGWYETRTSSGD